MASSINLPDIAQDAVPRNTPTPTQLQPVNNQEVAGALPGMVGLSATTVNLLNNTTKNGPENVMIITQSRGVHVGNVYNASLPVYMKQEKKTKKKSSTSNTSKPVDTPTPVVEALLSSSEVVTTAHVKDVRIGEQWRFVMRHLGLGEVEMENKYEECINKGIPEVIYQLLRLWIEKNGSAATVDKLSKALWSERQIDALSVLAEVYGISSPAK